MCHERHIDAVLGRAVATKSIGAPAAFVQTTHQSTLLNDQPPVKRLGGQPAEADGNVLPCRRASTLRYLLEREHATCFGQGMGSANRTQERGNGQAWRQG